ncbi:sodium:solute symporter family protein [Emergencia sp.]|uniref:sodium:solute symporter family protein n=1 Tax=Emergencia sp. TaxID=1926557 RepID=UPI003AF0A94A
MGVIPLIMLAIYFVIIIVLTLRTPKSGSGNFEDFMTGSKSMGAIVVGLVMMVTYYSGSTWTGWIGFAGINGAFAGYVIPYGFCTGLGMYALAKRLWPLGKQYQLSDCGDIYELRYQSKLLKTIAGLTGAILNTTWITMELVTIGYIIKACSGGAISTAVGSLIGLVFMVAYTLWGGVKSVASVNTFQSIVMVFGAVGIILYVVYHYYGSVGNMFSIALDISPQVFVLDSSMNASWFSFVFLCSIGALCYPSIFLKMFMAKSPNEVKKSAIMNSFGSLWCLLILLGGFACIGYQVATGHVIGNWEEALPQMMAESGNAVLFGIMCIFILAGCMGTVDGTLLSISGIVTNDAILVWKRHKVHDGCIGTKDYNGADDGGKSVKWTRIIVVIIGVCAYIITTFDLPLLVNIAMINYQGIGLLMIPLVGAVTWKKATKEGAFSGLIGGLLVTIALMTAGLNPLGFLPGIYGVIVEAILYIGISLATYKQDKPEAKMFEEFKRYTGDAVDGETGKFLA